MSPARIFVWVQHLLGAGHLRRALAIVEALAQRGADVLLISGGPRMPWPAPTGVELVQLPPVRAADASFRLVQGDGATVDEAVWTSRTEALLDAFERFRPDVVLTEMFPFGRSAFRRELLPLLARARTMQPRPTMVASVRDVLVTKADAAKQVAMRDLCLDWYDRVLVHGDARLIPLAATFPFAGALRQRLIHTGYVLTGTVPSPRSRAGILVSAGGGAVGERLLTAALDAARDEKAQGLGRWHLIAGSNLDLTRFDNLRSTAQAGLVVERHRDDFVDLLASASVSVSQAGYNTVVESLAARTPMVLVPFASGGEDEQTRRAELLAARGLAVHLPEAELTPKRLLVAVDAALCLSLPATLPIALDGAALSADLLIAMAQERRHA